MYSQPRRTHISPACGSNTRRVCPRLHCVQEYDAQGGPGTDITDAVPSLDMRPVLALFSPEDAFLRVEPCSACGGHLEIVTRETKRVAKLTKRIRCALVNNTVLFKKKNVLSSTWPLR